MKLIVLLQATKDCVAKTLKRLEEKIHGRVSIYFLHEIAVNLALAIHICSISFTEYWIGPVAAYLVRPCLYLLEKINSLVHNDGPKFKKLRS